MHHGHSVAGQSFANRAILAAAAVTSPLLKQRAHNELPEINAVITRHASRYALVPLLKDEPVGVDRLLQLASNGSDKAISTKGN